MTCPVAWALEDPNDEDRAMGYLHRCVEHDEAHAGEHRCKCGERFVAPEREKYERQ